MITIPVHTVSCSDEDFLLKKQNDYSYAFRFCYNNINLLNDTSFINKVQAKFKLTDIEYRSLVSDVNTKIEQVTTNKSNQEQKLLDITNDIKELNKKDKTNKITRSKFKKNKKVKGIENSLIRDITFGGKETLRTLTKLHNNKKVISRIANVKERNKQAKANELKIIKQTELFKDSRLLQFYIIGEANQTGNRFFNFIFSENKIIYKPFNGKKIEIIFTCSKRYKKMLLRLQPLIDNKQIPITLSISSNQVCISFDDEILSGYFIDKAERKKEVTLINKTNETKEKKTELIKDVYKKYHESLRKQKLIGKTEGRYMAIDTNPYYIGYCIADKGKDGIKRIIEKGFIDFSLLDINLGLASDDDLKIYQNNKRRFEINNTWKSLFEIANHYKVAHFVKEDIDNIGKKEASFSKEANRKNKNIWHRSITDWQIEKRCRMFGIELIPIEPCYTSFIGNLMYDYFDATNASIEICRRGMFKFDKGLFYPNITGTILDTMSMFIESQKIQLKQRDAQVFKDCKKWDGLYRIATDNAIRWRWDMEKVVKPSTVFSMSSKKSKVNIIRFN